MNSKELFNWYYCPGETLLSIGFYKNPYRQLKNAKFRHIFAFDAICNLYIGQYSVYINHINKVCNLDDQRENGIIYPAGSKVPPKYVDKLNEAELCVGEDQKTGELISSNIQEILPVVEFNFLETKNIVYLNQRLKKIAQRLYDYGLPRDTILFSPDIDLWNIRIYQVLKDALITSRPSLEQLQASL